VLSHRAFLHNNILPVFLFDATFNCIYYQREDNLPGSAREKSVTCIYQVMQEVRLAMKSFTVASRPPSYLSLTGKQWEEKLQRAKEMASPCMLCPRHCKAMRYQKSERPILGVCKTADKAIVSSVGPHFGEERPLVGAGGSGTIFFSYCNLKCIFCQNYELAHLGEGREVSDEELGGMMLQVQAMGCHNVNLVSPTHVVPNILAAVKLAAKQGLKIPLVYNTGGYDSLDTIRLLDGVVDIYMPDMKYGDSTSSEEFSLSADYPEVNFAVVKEMHRQVGDLVMDRIGVAVRGLLVRHLVLPGGLAGTEKVLEYIAGEISRDTYVNIMAQYRPYYRATGHPVLGRRITAGEYRDSLNLASRMGLTRVQAL
jgi:putative pyruvate formate lyase activating enzyme